MLARSLAAKGIYPAVDVLESTSTMLQPWIVGDAHLVGLAHFSIGYVLTRPATQLTDETLNPKMACSRVSQAHSLARYLLVVYPFVISNTKVHQPVRLLARASGDRYTYPGKPGKATRMVRFRSQSKC